MRVVCAVMLLCAALFAAAPAVALDRGLVEAQAAFDSGAFGRAALLARKVQTGEGDALASRAEMVRGDFVATGEARLAHFEAALRDGRRAVARAPDRPEAHLAVAVALVLSTISFALLLSTVFVLVSCAIFLLVLLFAAVHHLQFAALGTTDYYCCCCCCFCCCCFCCCCCCCSCCCCCCC